MGELDDYDRREQEEFAKGRQEEFERNERERIKKDNDRFLSPLVRRLREDTMSF